MNRRLMLEVDIENIPDRYIRQTVGEEVRRAWRLEDACKDLVANLDLTTMQAFVVNPKVYEQIIIIQKIIMESRKQ